MALPEHANIHELAREVARLLAHGESHSGGLLTARQVAVRFNVDRGWVYAHATELGVVRLGDGPRPRLRFDPAVVAQMLQARPSASSASPRPIPTRATTPLLPIRPSPARRTLGF
jgi:hypothetical protein